MLKPTIKYTRQANGKYLLSISYKGKTISAEIDKLPFNSTPSQPPQYTYSNILLGKDTTFEQVSNRLFNLGLNNHQVSEICKQIDKQKEVL